MEFGRLHFLGYYSSEKGTATPQNRTVPKGAVPAAPVGKSCRGAPLGACA